MSLEKLIEDIVRRIVREEIENAGNTRESHESPEYLSTRSVALMLGLSPITLAQWRVGGEGPAFIKAGRTVRYKRSDVDEWIAQRAVGKRVRGLKPYTDARRSLPIGPHVYFIQAFSGGPIKIGYSSNLKSRIDEHRRALNCEVRVLGLLPGGRDIEAAQHRRFAKFKDTDFSGKQRAEWFRPEPELIRYAERLPKHNAPPRAAEGA